MSQYFNPRSPHGERLLAFFQILVSGRFQPTLPARGATGGGVLLVSLEIFQPTLPARGATVSDSARLYARSFQPTLPARGATDPTFYRYKLEEPFQPTLPARGATARTLRNLVNIVNYFNPRSPHGERRARAQRTPTGADFNPRSPHGERPEEVLECVKIAGISTHAPRTGSDNQAAGIAPQNGDFNPRSPHGERPGAPRRNGGKKVFQPTLPARGAT